MKKSVNIVEASRIQSEKMDIEVFVSMLGSTVKGSEFVTVDLECPLDSKMNKGGRAQTNALYGTGMFYRTTMNGNLAGKYIEAVNRMLKRQATKTGETFEPRIAKAHPWGDLNAKRLFRINRKSGAKYLHMRVKNQSFGGYFNADGSPASEAQLATIKEYKKPVKEYGSSTQEGLKKKVMVKDYAMKNIRTVRMRKAEYQLTA